MAGVVIAYSLIPLIVLAGAGDGPYLFNAFWRLGVLAGCAAILVALHRDALRMLGGGGGWRRILQSARSPLLWLSALNGFDYALLAWASSYIDMAAAAVLFEYWPMAFVLLMAALSADRKGRLGRALRTAVPMLLLAVPGVALVALSQIHDGPADDLEWRQVGVGAALAVLGGTASACAAFSFRWAPVLQDRLSTLPGAPPAARLGLFCLITAFMFGNLLALPLTIAIGGATGETLSWSHIYWGLLGGAAVQAVGSVLFRAANAATNRLSINALYYLTPCLTLAWLATLGFEPQVHRWDCLLAGAALIMTSNALPHILRRMRPAPQP